MTFNICLNFKYFEINVINYINTLNTIIPFQLYLLVDYYYFTNTTIHCCKLPIAIGQWYNTIIYF